MLKFEKVITPAKDAAENFLANQPDNSLYQHYVSETHTPWQVHAQITLADYDNLTWSDTPEVCMTPREVRHIGVKSFPQLGAIGFYHLRYRDSSRVVIPLHGDKDKKTAPGLSIELNTDAEKLSYYITPSESMRYDCYRIVLELENQSYSHVVYELNGEIDPPEPAGTYRCFAVGYLQEGQICSKDSDVSELTLETHERNTNAKFCTESEVKELLSDTLADYVKKSDLEDGDEVSYR